MSAPPFKVKAVFEYTSPHDDDLHFPNGQIITVIEEEDEDWYVGEYVDASGTKQEGLFPKNFVEKYEPTAPPRPARTARPKKEAEPEPAVAASVPEPEDSYTEPAPKEPAIPEPEEEAEEAQTSPVIREPPLPAYKTQIPAVPEAAQPVLPAVAQSPKPIATSSKPPGPPPISDKPSGNSFRDRIAAFNKAAPPPAPFKPGGLGSGSSNFIKKPFVAPPPSKNAFIPPPREPVPQKIYRREEDPEIAAKESEDRDLAEKAGLTPASNEDAEEQPKPTSLKERIALLQKQQMEQANRHADAAAKKEKPKRPAKKRNDSQGPAEPEGGEMAGIERQATGDTIGKKSMDSVREDLAPRHVPRRKSSSRPGVPIPVIDPRKSFGDGNEADMSGAGETTEEPEEMSDEKPKSRPAPPARAPTHEPDVGEEEGAVEEEEPLEEVDEDEEEEEEEDDVDPEVRRKEELRARMAKMSGGMGMHGMFGGGMPMPMAVSAPKKKKPSASSESRAVDEIEEASPSARAPPVPMIPLPGLSRTKTSEPVEREEDAAPITSTRPAEEVPDVEDVVPQNNPQPVSSHEAGGAPPVPGGRPAPPPVPKESRPAAPSSMPTPSAGSESDDEISIKTQSLSLATPSTERPPPPPRPAEASPRSPTSRRASYFGADPTSPNESTPNRRASRVPPIPGAALPSPAVRAPPPPPPGALSRTSTGDPRAPPPAPPIAQQESEGEVTEYDGDYDTDIPPTAPHKDALKSSKDDDNTPVRSSPHFPTTAPPPLPPVAAPRAVPPPPKRQSVDMPTAAPPPPPPASGPAYHEDEDEDEYDPYKYIAPQSMAPSAPSIGAPTPRVERNEDDLYGASPPRSYASPAHDRAAPPPPSRDAAAPKQPLRKSTDMQRAGTTRRSVDLSRMSMDSGYVANDVDLAQSSTWWTSSNGVPPAFQNRKDLLHECEESTSKRDGLVTKDVYILFQDYSQTIITVKYDPQNASDATLEQRHEPPPSRLRQDQLEQAHEQFGRKVYDAVISKQNTIVGDGTPQGLVQELLKPFADALLPVGTRAYGALVYGNLANASTQQNDEIRPGDIITLRNTKFQGKHGPMHAKYSAEIGKPDHVGVVAEWDGTKKKVRAWEQGRESKKVKLESFKLDDLRSGEVKIWRIMPRSWVGWEGQN